jgi:hypothetical protein
VKFRGTCRLEPQHLSPHRLYTLDTVSSLHRKKCSFLAIIALKSIPLCFGT